MMEFFKERTGAAILPMVLVITTLVGSYHYYNKGVSKTSSEILASSRVSTAQADAFAYNAANRLVNLIKEGKKCYGDDPNDKAFIKKLKRFAKSFAGSESDLDRELEFGYISGGDSDDDAVECIASPEELSGIKDFKVILKAQRFNSCSNAIKISVKGRTQSTGGGNTEVEFKNQVRINISFLRNLEFAVNFSEHRDDQNIAIGGASHVEFETPVFIGRKSDSQPESLDMKDFIFDGKDKSFTGGGGVVFSEGFIFSGSSVTYGDDVNKEKVKRDGTKKILKVWNFGVLQQFFPQGIRLNTGLNKDQLSTVASKLGAFTIGNCDGSTERVLTGGVLDLGSDLPDKSVCAIGGGLTDPVKIKVPKDEEEYTLYANVLMSTLLVIDGDGVKKGGTLKIRHLRDAPEIGSFSGDQYSFQQQFFKAGSLKHSQECANSLDDIAYDKQYVYYVR